MSARHTAGSYGRPPADPDRFSRWLADNDLLTSMRRRGLVVAKDRPGPLVWALVGAGTALGLVGLLLVVVGRMT